MLLATHWLAGAYVVAKLKINTVPLALFAGVCSHFILDLIPHNNFRTHTPWLYRKASSGTNRWPRQLINISVFHLLFFLILTLYFFHIRSYLPLVGALSGIFPDIYEWFRYSLNPRLLPTLHLFHNANTKDYATFLGTAVQILSFFALLFGLIQTIAVLE